MDETGTCCIVSVEGGGIEREAGTDDDGTVVEVEGTEDRRAGSTCGEAVVVCKGSSDNGGRAGLDTVTSALADTWDDTTLGRDRRCRGERESSGACLASSEISSAA